jgi:mono/diheme cytochrome c family protein
MPRADYAEPAAALRGRYLAGEIGACLDCHTPRGKSGPDFERAFQGGLKFGRSELRLPPDFPEVIYSRNLTPHATGIAEWSVADVVRAVKHGQDRQGKAMCPPMPAGPREAFGGLSDSDVNDIAHYLLSLPPGEHALEDCHVPGSEMAAGVVQ